MTKDIEQRLTELEDRIKALERVFAPHVLSNKTDRSESSTRDARQELSVGNVKTITIFDPPGHGSDPEHGIGKINGIVTFVDCRGLEVDQNEVLKCRITDVQQNAAEAVAIQRTDRES